jgi:hypothetical protein
MRPQYAHDTHSGVESKTDIENMGSVPLSSLQMALTGRTSVFTVMTTSIAEGFLEITSKGKTENRLNDWN